MPDVVRFENVSKHFLRSHALSNFSLSIGASRIVGIIGTNGSGKSTLFRHIVGIYLPTQGECFTFDTPARRLSSEQLSRIGMVHQQEEFLSWMSVRELLGYVGAFYANWDRDMQQRLVRDLELDPGAKVDSLSPGKRQRLAMILAVCHRPELLLLDEPLSDLDPLAREQILRMILDVFRESGNTILISSHMLHDIERIVDHVVCLDGGKLILDEPLDHLKERFAEWTVLGLNGSLPARFSEPWILSQEGDARERVLVVSDALAQQEAFAREYGVRIESKPLNLGGVFSHVVAPLHRRAQRS
jgi:ABC-2 type transport system ATP-binding protein